MALLILIFGEVAQDLRQAHPDQYLRMLPLLNGFAWLMTPLSRLLVGLTVDRWRHGRRCRW